MSRTLFDVYDATGGVTVGDTEVVVAFDTARFLSNHCTLSSGEITVQLPSSKIIPPADYDLLLMAKITNNVSSGNSRSMSKAWIEVDTGGGYTAIPGVDGYMYNRTAGNGWGTVLLMTTYQINKIENGTRKFRIRTQRAAGTNTIVTLANASNFVCTIHT